MANTGFNLNRGLIRRFDYSNLPTTNVQPATATTGILTIKDNSNNYVQKFGAINIAKVQNMLSTDVYEHSSSESITASDGINNSLNIESLNNASINVGDCNINLSTIHLSPVILTNTDQLTSL
jgi:hypothetical protein